MRDFFCRLGAELRRLRREEDGVIIACSLAVFLFLYVLGCGVYALGTTIYEREALQNAADAAAYSAASIQADALSRMAMLNKALSYTYIQMSRKQMDCITAQWLRLVYQRYEEDSTWAYNWASVFFADGRNLPKDLFSFIKWIYDMLGMNNGNGLTSAVKNCYLLYKRNGEAWFCGSQGQVDTILINGRSVPSALLKSVVVSLENENAISSLKAAIVEDKQTLFLLNNTFPVIHESMCESMRLVIASVLSRNLRAAFGDDALDECYFATKIPEAVWNPYLASMTPSAQTVTRAGYFNVLNNVEGDERRFLGMAGEATMGGQSCPTTDWTLPDFFVSPSTRDESGTLMQFFSSGGSRNLKSAGLDQWFVRGAKNSRIEGAAGIQRTFWTANAKERLPLGALEVTRGNHLLSGDIGGQDNIVQQILSSILSAFVSMLDIQPSVCNSLPGKQVCRHINNTQALVAEYEWATAKWLSWNLKKKRIKKFSPKKRWVCRTCENGGSFKPWGHIAIPKTYCGASEHRKGRFWHDILGNAEEMFMMGDYWAPASATHGYVEKPKDNSGKKRLTIATILKGLKMQFRLNRAGSDIPRETYESCAMGIAVGSTPLFIRGCARIYGDDKAICRPHDEVWTNPDGSPKTPEQLIDEVNIYEGARAEPWILSERFFGPDGTITVAVAKRRRNPWMQLLGDAVESVRSLYSVGNPAGKNEAAGTYMWALSSGRAAFRDPVDGSLQGSYRYLNKERQHDGLGDFEPGESGCVCDTTPARLERQWNLCVTEWEPTLVPVAMADAFRAVEDQFVANPQQETSGLAKLLYLDFVDDGTIQKDEGDESGWLPLSGEGDPKKTDEFLRVAAPGSGDGPTFGPENKADWPKTLWPRKIL